MGLISRDGDLITALSQLPVSLSAEGAKNVSWSWLSPLRGWGSLTMLLTGKVVYMAHHFILLSLNLFELGVDREGWWFEHSCVIAMGFFSAEGAKNLPGPWLSLFQRWGSQTMPLRAKFIYIGHHLILLQFNPFDDGVDREGWWFEHPCVIVVGFHVSRGC